MSSPDKTNDARAARLAEALRENLRKRKSQARAREEAALEADGPDAAGAEKTKSRDGTNRPRDDGN